ncbi:MAG TPA: efflux RND transporter periplasmic adaptor subunit [Vicinamibacterales bacterium]|jgi:RND family efflux transporter MFP subunit|nr:efflux RND transporter periplasmic adaptor subunit [Vicinamibacterales bacterium]
MNERRGVRVGPIVGGLVLTVAALGLAFWGISTRARALDVVTKETRELALLTVTVVAPQRGVPREEIVLPGTMQAFTDASIYARTNGYLKRRLVDIGSKVRAGQLLAEIDTPELDQQIDQARADLATAEANSRLATTTADRYRELIKTESVSRQDLDNANGNLEARQTAVESARANVKRLEQLNAFRRIEAPFDGVITARNTEIGALIDSGSNARELFHIAEVHRLRVFVSVPQVYSQLAQPGIKAELTLKEFGGRTFTGTLARTSQSIDVASRTLLTEIDVDNPKGELLPGSYAEVHLKLPTPAASLQVPVSALIFRTEGLQVATVKGDRVQIVTVVAGRDFGSDVEIVSGLTGTEQVVANPPDSLVDGVRVRVVPAVAASAGADR